MIYLIRWYGSLFYHKFMCDKHLCASERASVWEKEMCLFAPVRAHFCVYLNAYVQYARQIGDGWPMWVTHIRTKQHFTCTFYHFVLLLLCTSPMIFFLPFCLLSMWCVHIFSCQIPCLTTFFRNVRTLFNHSHSVAFFFLAFGKNGTDRRILTHRKYNNNTEMNACLPFHSITNPLWTFQADRNAIDI